MMKVTVQFHAQARSAVGSTKQSLELPDGSTLAQLLDRLAELHGPELRNMMRSSLLFIGDQQARPESPRALRDGDVVTMVSPISGG